MATQVQFRRGTTGEHAAFTGAVGEVTVDTTLKTLKVHDGATTGGVRIARYSDLPPAQIFNVVADDSATITVNAEGGEIRFTGGSGLTSSTDSAGTVTYSLDKIIDVNTISSGDSTAVTINDGLIVTGNFSFDDGVAVDTILDQDNFASNSDSALATQQSIKAYVDGAISASSTASIVQGNSSVTVADAGVGTVTVTIDGATNSTFTAAGFSTDTVNVNVLNSTDSTAIQVTDALNVSGAVTSAGGFVGNADTATEATNVTATANNTTNETVYLTFVDGATGTQGIETDTDLTYNPSTNVLSTTASAAQYADLAERYQSDREYDEGHVVVLGGAKEITESTHENDTRVAGVISERWAYLMNEKEQGPAVALKGKVLCKVVGSVAKGDLLVSSATPGHAVASDTPNPMAVIGRSMVDDADTHPRKVFIKI